MTYLERITQIARSLNFCLHDHPIFGMVMAFLLFILIPLILYTILGSALFYFNYS